MFFKECEKNLYSSGIDEFNEKMFDFLNDKNIINMNLNEGLDKIVDICKNTLKKIEV